MKGSSLIQFLQFFAGIIIVLLIIYSSYIVSFNILKRNWMNSKLFSETLSTSISSISSSTFDVSSKIFVGKSCDVKISGNEINVKIGDDAFTGNIVLPDYVKVRDSSSTCSDKFITIKKVGDEVWIE